MIDVDARQATLKAERETLQSARVLAMIDGGEYDSRRLAEIDTELAALDDVANEVARRTIQQAKDEAERRRTGTVAAIQERETERYVELVRAQQHAAALAQALSRFKALTGEQVVALESIGLNAPLGHWPAQVDRRLSQLLVATLFAPISNKRDAFGIIDWGSVPFEARAAWPDYEKSACALALEDAINPQQGTADDKPPAAA